MHAIGMKDCMPSVFAAMQFVSWYLHLSDMHRSIELAELSS